MSETFAKTIQRRVLNKKIVDISLNPFEDGRGGVANSPVIILEDGTEIVFQVQETDVGCYGVTPLVRK